MFGGFRAARRADVPDPAGPARRRSCWSRRRSRTRSGRRPTSPSGWAPSACRWPGWCSTGCTAPAVPALSAERERGGGGRAGRGRRPRRSPRTRCGSTRRWCGRPSGRRGWPPTFTDEFPAVPAVAVDGAARRRPRRRRAADDRRLRLAALTRWLSRPRPAPCSRVLLLPQRGLEHPPPARHVRVPAQQRAALPLGHAAPHAELDPVVERVGQALVPHRAAAADPLRHVLLGALHEQRVRVATPARRHAGPVGDHPHLSTSPLAFTPGRPALRPCPPSRCRRRAMLAGPSCSVVSRLRNVVGEIHQTGTVCTVRRRLDRAHPAAVWTNHAASCDGADSTRGSQR